MPRDVLVCEGESDALAAVCALEGDDLVAVLSLPGASFPARVLIAALRDAGASVAALAFDGDCAGGMNAERLAWELVAAGIGARILAVPFNEDLASTLGACGDHAACVDGRAWINGVSWPCGRAWLEAALLAARPVGLTEAALVAENLWLRGRCLDLHLASVGPPAPVWL